MKMRVLRGDFCGNGNIGGFCWWLVDMGVLEMRRRENRGKRLWGSGVVIYNVINTII